MSRNRSLSNHGSSAYTNTGTGDAQLPTNADLATGAFTTVGTAAGELPTNADLATGAFTTVGTAATELPTNADLATGAFTTVGTAATLDTGTAAGELPTNADLATGAFTTVGTAATADVTTEIMDNTPGRLLKFGDYGIGDSIYITNFNQIPTHFYGKTSHISIFADATVVNGPAGVVSSSWVGTYSLLEQTDPNAEYLQQTISAIGTDSTFERYIKDVGNMNFFGNWIEVVKTDGAGNVNINGTFTASGDITSGGDVVSNSDIRLKSDIKLLTNAVDTVKALRGVTYIKDDKASIGLIAQEVEEVLPQMVHTADDEMGTKSVNYQNMVALLIEAVKEQQKEIDALKEKSNVN